MPYIAVSVTSNQGKIKIQLDALTNNGNPFSTTLAAKIKEDYRYTDSVALKAELDESISGHGTLQVSEKGEIKTYKRYTVIYHLPVTPDYAVHLIVVLADHLRKFHYSAETLTFLPVVLDDFITNDQLNINAENLFTGQEHITADKLIKAIVDIKDHPLYAPVQTALTKLLNNARTVNKPFVESVDIETRLRLMSDGVIMSLVNPTVDMEEKLRILLEMARDMVKIGQNNQLNYTLRTLNYLARKKLFEPCIDKLADDGGLFNWRYTEWELLRFAEFTFRPDGRLSIKNLQDNPKYKEFYAPGARNHDILEREMRHMGKIIGLEFAEDCNFHGEIIFTEQCTQDLKAKGLHFGEAYVKKLLQAKNYWIVFNQGFKYPANQEGKKSPFFRMPLDIIEMIRNSMNLKADVIVDQKELSKVGFFGRRQAVQLTMTEVEEVVAVKPLNK